MNHAEDLFKQILNKGEIAIDDFINNRESESLFLDFKRATNNGAGNKLDPNDRKNLAKAISGFGNSEGGLIVWGVDCREGEDYADVARTKFPIEDAKKFESWLEGAISSCTLPPHSTVKHHTILSKDNKTGYVISFIPKSNHAPHQVITAGKGQYHYFIRTGSDFSPTPHAVLSGMFGRRPQPNVFIMYGIDLPEVINSDPKQLKLYLGLQVANGGQGIASDIFMNFHFSSSPGGGCSLQVQPQDLDNWVTWNAFGVRFTAISKKDIRLPPGALLQPFAIILNIAPPFTGEFKIEGICGCGQSQSYNFTIENNSKKLEELYYKFLYVYETEPLKNDDKTQKAFDFWNLYEISEISKQTYGR